MAVRHVIMHDSLFGVNPGTAVDTPARRSPRLRHGKRIRRHVKSPTPALMANRRKEVNLPESHKKPRFNVMPVFSRVQGRAL